MNRYTCRGCDRPILFGVYCQECGDEVAALVSARPFVWPRWTIIVRDVLLCVSVILLVCYCLYLGIVDIADGSI